MAPLKTIRAILAPGRRLDCGNACEVAALLLKNPRKAGQVVECLWDEDAGVANRAADALERASSRRPEMLARWKGALLDRMLDAEENKLRWNLALMIWRTPLKEAETARVAGVLPEVLDMLRILRRSRTPAMRARGRILLKSMEAGKALQVVTGELP